MAIVTLTKTMYRTTDGREFFDKDEAQRHETKWEKVKVFTVHARNVAPSDDPPGTTPPMRQVGFMVVSADCHHEEIAKAWMGEKYGPEYGFRYGEKWSSPALLAMWSISAYVHNLPEPEKVVVTIQDRFCSAKLWADGVTLGPVING